jgi:hypothetical protein
MSTVDFFSKLVSYLQHGYISNKSIHFNRDGSIIDADV